MRGKPHISLFLPTLDSDGGVERIMVDLAREFAKRGFGVDLVIAYGGKGSVFGVPEGVRIVDLAARKTMFSPLALARYLRRNRPDALLAALDHANFVAVIARALARTHTYLVLQQASTFSSHINVMPWPRRLLELVLGRLLYPLGDAVVCVSQGVLDDMLECRIGPSRRFQVVYNPVVTLEIFDRASEPISHPWFLGDRTDRPVLLAVGSLTPPKDFSTLLDAVATLRADGVQARLVILGEGHLRGALESQRSRLGLDDVVDMPGFDSNPFRFMAACDAYVLSSAWEGLPSVLLQAAALGAPLVATDCRSGPAEIISIVGRGQLAPVGDARALADAIRIALTHNGRSRCADRRNDPSVAPFTPSVVVPQYLRVLGVAA